MNKEPYKEPHNVIYETSTRLIQPIIKRLGEQITNKGLPSTIDTLLKKGRCFVTSKMSEETKQAFENMTQGILIIATHPKLYEPYPIIASLPKTRPFYMLANEGFETISPEFSKHLIPIANTFPPSQGNRGRLLRMIGFQDGTGSYKENYTKNKEALTRASDLVNNRKIVIVFVEGVDLEGQRWQKGLGSLVQKLQDNTLMVMANVSKPQIDIKKGSIKIPVNYSDPLKPNDVLATIKLPNNPNKKEQKEYRNRIVDHLEDLYRDFSG